MAEKTGSPKKGQQHETTEQTLQQQETPKAKTPEEELPPELPPLEETEKPQTQTRKVFPVVGIGASAGGLEALETFFDQHAGRPGDMALVIIQHLSPKHKSIMGQISQERHPPAGDGNQQTAWRWRPMPSISTLRTGKWPSYQGVLHLMEPGPRPATPGLPIDYFFRSLARGPGREGHLHRLVRHRQRRHPGTAGGQRGRRPDHGPGGRTRPNTPSCPGAPSTPAWWTTSCRWRRWPAELMRYVQHPYLEARTKSHTRDQTISRPLSKRS